MERTFSRLHSFLREWWGEREAMEALTDEEKEAEAIVDGGQRGTLKEHTERDGCSQEAKLIVIIIIMGNKEIIRNKYIAQSLN